MPSGSSLDLDEVTLVNESRSEKIPGDISVFATRQAACSHLEAWWVKDGEGTVLTANGDRLSLTTSQRVKVAASEPHPNGMELVRIWAQAAAENLKQARGDTQPLPLSIRELIAYIGFDD